MGKGAPPCHLHFAQDEWFYLTKGEFALEVGDKKIRLKPLGARVACLAP
jgi:uncharacterized cupin superfamily protein